MIYSVTRMSPVITGGQLKVRREALGLTQAQFGELIGEEGKTIGNWERADHIPPKKQQKVQEALGGTDPTAEVGSDVDLLAALTARFSWYANRIAELETLVAELSRSAEEINRGGGVRAKPSEPNGPRAAWGRGPRSRQQGKRDDDVPHDKDS